MKGVVGKLIAIGVLALSSSPVLANTETYVGTNEKTYTISTDAINVKETLYSDSAELKEPSILEKALRLALLGLPIFIGAAAIKNILAGVKKDK